ncbi:MAG: DUF503 domain-containing protein [Planctomycetota bacterium]
MLYIGILQFSMDIPYAASLKDKRSVVNRLKDRIRRKFNVSISEIDDLDTWQVATFGAVMAGTDVAYINGALDKLLAFLHDDRDATLADHQLEILTPQ